MSTVVELYLLQLKSLLPRARRDDVVAEIGESIAAAIEERERELGRKLDDAETSAILLRYGHPIAVAGRYLPMQQLIGPRVFPLYWYMIQGVVVVIAAIAGIVAAIALLTEPRATRAAMQVLVGFFWIALDAAALVTLLFVLLDRRHARFRFLDVFDARKLGVGLLGTRFAPLGEIPRRETVFDLAVVAILLLWWTDVLVFPRVVASVKVELGAALTALYLPVIALCTIDLVRLGVEFAHPYRTLPRIGVAVASNVAWLVLLGLAFFSPDLLQAAPSIEDPAEIERVVTIAERVFRAALLGVGAWTASQLWADLARLRRHL
jgi:hypothetical protein